MSSLSSRTRSAPAGFIEPCLPSPADKPPSGAKWIHEIKHDGYRLMARRDAAGVRLATLRGPTRQGRSVDEEHCASSVTPVSELPLMRCSLMTDSGEDGSVLDPELLIGMVQMDLNSTFGKTQPAPNLLVRQAFRYQLHNLAFAFR
jgi:hypothetical protein